ncbi:PHP domain-containing protein [Alteromonas flava]|uniref:PHP domain-containing protein n=1 Tax=Alteromonas flava TaxID=2048003 RepID=UPI001F0C968D|nr:PHP domain-containing protein [Alteromonas flava]
MSTVNFSNQQKIDLHTHTRCSDGQLTPAELVMRAHTMQVDVLAITDHDTVSGVAAARAFQHTQKRPLSIISGIELSTRWHGFDIHVVGLNVDEDNPQFLARLAQQHACREQRAIKIADKLAKCGMPDVGEAVLAMQHTEQVTRSHFAKAMVTLGHVKDPAQAFKQYLGKGKRAHVSPQWIALSEAIEWIHAAGGQAVLAHPSHYSMTTKWLRRLVAEFSSAGGDAMEVNYPNLTPDKQRLLLEMLSENNLKASVGSDFHMPSRWTELGRRSRLPDGVMPIWHDWPIIDNASSQRDS